MKFFQGFLHFNIRCSEEDLPSIEKFYGDVLDLRIGPRPDFAVPGIWLYCEDDPIFFMEHFCYIQTEGGATLFPPFDYQKEMIESFQKYHRLNHHQ